MTTQDYIDKNKTETFKKGDKVVMHGCHEATLPQYKGKEWICKTDSYQRGNADYGYQDLVFLEGFSGCFAAEYLKRIGGV